MSEAKAKLSDREIRAVLRDVDGAITRIERAKKVVEQLEPSQERTDFVDKAARCIVMLETLRP